MVKIITGLALILTGYAAQAQVVYDSLLVEGYYRTFCFKKPSHDTRGGSLVFAMHGSGGTAAAFMKHTGKIDEKMSVDHFMLVFPQGYGKYWNECRKASTAEANKIDINEEAFFLAMIDYFVGKYGINRKKVFASGVSGGGQMAYKMGLRLPDRFRAVAALVANMPSVDNMDCVASGKPVATLIINGTADPVNPDEGGEMKAGFSLGRVVSTRESFAYWARLAGYEGEPEKKALPDPVPGNNISMESYSYKKEGRPEVTLIRVINGVHGQPEDMDFYTEVWDFFKRQLNGQAD
ncbi:MAG: poly(3-hydroxybutyrate) depolymerase [Cytophagaceae bacterium SCN 52-12]|nr:MAG: poly(3-hydroxybutyrate) depolymerase [Cytophagaceae bacterium SCN 52-12]